MTSCAKWCMNILLFFILIISLIIGFLRIIPDDPRIQIASNITLSFSNSTPKSFYDIRSEYVSALEEIKKIIESMKKNGESEKNRAIACNAMRSEARRNLRVQNPSYRHTLLRIFLQARDSYVHALKYFPQSIVGDVQKVLQNHTIHPSKTYATIKQFRDCLASSEHRLCPSYNFLLLVRGKTEEELLASCTKSNEFFDRMFQK